MQFLRFFTCHLEMCLSPQQKFCDCANHSNAKTPIVCSIFSSSIVLLVIFSFIRLYIKLISFYPVYFLLPLSVCVLYVRSLTLLILPSQTFQMSRICRDSYGFCHTVPVFGIDNQFVPVFRFSTSKSLYSLDFSPAV